jgi:hypothetical protein
MGCSSICVYYSFSKCKDPTNIYIENDISWKDRNGRCKPVKGNKFTGALSIPEYKELEGALSK